MLKDTMTRFEKKFVGWKIHHKTSPCIKDEFVINEMKQFWQEEIKLALEDYTDFLCKYGYTDSDVYAEEPKAVDRFLSGEK